MRTGAFALLCSFLAVAAIAQKTDDEFLNDLYKARSFAHVAISPDGKRVAWVVEDHGLTVANVDGTNRKHIDDATAMAFSPDGARLAYLAGKAPKQLFVEAAPGSGDNNYWIAKLHVVDVARAAMQPLYTPKLQIADPRWSPDGKSIALIEGLMSDEGSTGGDVMLIDAASGAARNLTPAMKASATSLSWSDGEHLVAGEIVGGDAALVRLRASDGASETLWRGGELVTTDYVVGASIARDGTTSAVIRSSIRQPPEVWAGAIGAWKKVSSENAAIHATWGGATSLRWKSDDFDVQGWLIAPAHVESGRRYPIIVWVHGGPASASLARWPDERAGLLSIKGYYVLFPNPRGSYGNGKTFTQANVKAFGGGALRDIVRGIDAAAGAAPVDAHRAGLWGWSYGGFMTMFAVTQTDRFKAAVAGAGISNWQSYYGENDIDQWMIPYFGAP